LTLLDANALIAVFLGEPAMEKVLEILRRGKAAMAATNVAEVFDVSARRHGLPVSRVADLLEPLLEGPLTPIAVDPDLARRAGEVRLAHYHRKRRPLSLADCVLLAAATGPKDRIATSDSDVLAVAAELGIETIALPPSLDG
jgi:predicted nucleic acid-binding protein